MIGSVSASRRAHAFAQALDEQSAGGPAADHCETDPPEAHHGGTAGDIERAGMLAVAGGLQALPGPVLDPEVKAVHRAQLIAAMEAASAERRAAGDMLPERRAAGSGRRSQRSGRRGGALERLRPRSRLSKGLAAGGLTVGVAAGALTGVAAASTNALPGDSLYGLKRGMEDLKLGMASGDVERGKVHLDHASTRLREARRLMERQRAGRLDEESLAEVRRALSGMQHNASEGHRLLSDAYHRDGSLSPIRSLSTFAEEHRTTWSRLRAQLPPQLSDVSDQVNSVFDAIDSQVGPVELRFPAKGDDKNRTGPTADSDPNMDAGAEGATRLPSAPEPESDTDTGSEGSRTEDSSRPTPAATGEGLLGGGQGVLDPPADTSDRPSGTEQGESEPTPDITVPPLLRDLLPGLGLQAPQE